MLDLLHLLRERLNMLNDPFSDFLQLMSAESVMSGAMIAGGPWAMSIPPPDEIKFWGVMRGSCWLSLEGEAAPIQLKEGDVFLLATPCAVLMASDLSAPPVSLSEVLKHRVGAVARLGTGDDCFVIGGGVELGADHAQLLLNVLPPFVHVRAEARQTQTLRWLMNQMVQEGGENPLGAQVACSQLAHLMFIHILRAHFANAEPMAAGWLRAVTDKRLAPAMRLMHGEPGRSWDLEELAKSVAMSRATFALYFKTVAGIAPMLYLTEWRMRLAEKALHESKAPIGELGRSLGYSSESAFSNAFKRVTGRSPIQFRRGLKQRSG